MVEELCFYETEIMCIMRCRSVGGKQFTRIKIDERKACGHAQDIEPIGKVARVMHETNLTLLTNLMKIVNRESKKKSENVHSSPQIELIKAPRRQKSFSLNQ
jgi:hypothetical protein